MIEFRRTDSGLRNLHIFFRVERLVYCEGGSSPHSMDDIVSGAGDSETLDVCFWQTVFRVFNRAGSTHFKSVGCKATLQSIASSVIANNISSILVCIDRDYASFQGNLIQDARVIYTYGYSWENDILGLDILERVFFGIRNRSAEGEEAWKSFRKHLEEFYKSCCRHSALDIHFCINDLDALIPHSEPQRALITSRDARPRIDENYLRARLTRMGYRRGPHITHNVTIDNVATVTFGKLLSRYVYHAMRYHAHLDSGQFQTYKQFMRACIGAIEIQFGLDAASPQKQHYEVSIPAL